MTTLEQTEEAVYSKAENILINFFKPCWDVLEPNNPILKNWHQTLISEYLEACYKREITRLIINIPPRYTKSTLVSVVFPVWAWVKSPHIRFIFASYAQTLATQHSVNRRNIIESPWFQRGYGKRFKLSTDQNVKTEFQNNHRGVMTATSILGSATGKGGDFIIIDDPHNVKGSESDVQREAIITQFDRTFSTRLNDKKTGVMIVVMQRLHQRDLSGHLLSLGGWEHLKIKGVEEERKVYSFPITKRTIIRNPGEILHPEREDEKEIEKQKRALGSYGFSGQYQQEPSPPGGAIFKREWYKFYDIPPAKFEEEIISFDLTFKELSESDYVVGQCWGRVGANKYLLDQVRGRMDFLTTIRAFQAFSVRHPNAILKLVEEKANGAALINSMKNKIPGIVAVNPKDSKESRAQAIAPEFEAGNIYLPNPDIHHWVNDFIEEMSQFPKGRQDDQVDATTQALLRFQDKASGNFIDSMIHESNSIVQDIISEGDAW